MPILRRIFVSILALSLTSPAIAQQAIPQQPAGTVVAAPADPAVQDVPEARVDDVIVYGRPLEEIAAEFIEDIAAPAAVRGLARWNRPVCLGVMNLRREAAEDLLARISTIAQDHGVEVAAPGCEPDVFIIATDDGRALATELVAAGRRRLFRPGAGATQIGQPPSVLEHFQTSDDPVRWWHTSLPTDSETGQIMVTFFGDRPASIAINNVSKRRGRIRDDLKRVLIIVDLNAASSATWEQLSAYLAMVSIAQIDAVSDKTSHSTILNLFTASEPAPGLTEWDGAYLRSLYLADDRRILPVDRAGGVADILRTGAPSDDGASPQP